MSRAVVNGVDLYVESRGAGPTILGVHGTPSSARLWEDAAVVLARHGRCVTYDRRGFLRSDRVGHFDAVDLDDHVDDAAALLAGTPAVVIGRSTGGLVALELARREPRLVRALVLLEPAVLTIDAAAADWAATLRRRIVSGDAAAAAETVVRAALGDAAWVSFPPDLRSMFRSTTPGVMAELRGEGLDLSERPRRYAAAELESVRVPTLLVAADDSPAELSAVVDRLAAALPRASTVRVRGGHLIDPAGPEVLAFMDEHADRGAP